MNVDDDAHEFVFGPHVTSSDDDVPPFYVSLNVHDRILHNAMLDFGASHNLMSKLVDAMLDSGASHNLISKLVIDNLGLQITRPYKDFFFFDSKKVKCLGLIKDLVVTLA